MEHVKPSYVAPVHPIQPMPMPMPNLQPSYHPMPQPHPLPHLMPVAEKPAHTDIHLHSSYEQTTIFVPPPKPVHKPVHKPVMVHSHSSSGAILVLFILLVIIARSYPKC